MAYHLSGATFTTHWFLGPIVVLITSLAHGRGGRRDLVPPRGIYVGPRYRLDAAGITGPRGKPSLPWAAVGSYRITTHRDVLGNTTLVTQSLNDHAGNLLLHFRFNDLVPGDADRLLAFITARFPKPIKDDTTGWD